MTRSTALHVLALVLRDLSMFSGNFLSCRLWRHSGPLEVVRESLQVVIGFSYLTHDPLTFRISNLLSDGAGLVCAITPIPFMPNQLGGWLWTWTCHCVGILLCRNWARHVRNAESAPTVSRRVSLSPSGRWASVQIPIDVAKVWVGRPKCDSWVDQLAMQPNDTHLAACPRVPRCVPRVSPSSKPHAGAEAPLQLLRRTQPRPLEGHRGQ